MSPYSSRAELEKFVRQLAAAGFDGVGMFVWSIPIVIDMFGSFGNYVAYLKERGLAGGVVDIFWASPTATPVAAPHRRETHDGLAAMLGRFVETVAGHGVENLVVMPTNAYRDMEPVTDDFIAAIAELWNRVGRHASEHGLKLGSHHEFWGGIRTLEQIDRFYELATPGDVHLFIDTAQHVIAEVDPVALYHRYHDRVSGFHFKDTRHVDRAGDYRSTPDAELVASTTRRWFYEMGTPGGLVDFPAMMQALKAHNYQGWVGVEHDKADIDGNYAESTALAMWYARRALEPIYR
jgi:sugar phosphate isomerase/epimerase